MAEPGDSIAKPQAEASESSEPLATTLPKTANDVQLDRDGFLEVDLHSFKPSNKTIAAESRPPPPAGIFSNLNPFKQNPTNEVKPEADAAPPSPKRLSTVKENEEVDQHTQEQKWALKLANRRPRCDECLGSKKVCDGKPQCSNCHNPKDCIYMACPRGSQCKLSACVNMHPEQWGEAAEPRWQVVLPTKEADVYDLFTHKVMQATPEAQREFFTEAGENPDKHARKWFDIVFAPEEEPRSKRGQTRRSRANKSHKKRGSSYPRG